MKKFATLIFTLTLCFALAFVCFAAEDDHGEIVYDGELDFGEEIFATAYEDGSIFVTGEGVADLYNLVWLLGFEYFDNNNGTTVYIGEHITNIINVGDVCVKKYVVDQNNPYLSSDDSGIIYSKDKTELVKLPSEVLYDDVYTVPDTIRVLKAFCFEDCNFSELIIPDSVETIESFAFSGCDTYYIELPDSISVIEEYSFSNYYSEILVLPESVHTVKGESLDNYWDYSGVGMLVVMNPDCVIETLNSDTRIVSYSNGAVESFAEENGNPFASLDENHSHIYIRRITTAPTCTQPGVYTYSCPCGNAAPYVKDVEATGHYMDYDHPAEDGEVYCKRCSAKADCECICHKAERENASLIDKLIYKFLCFFWKLFSINEYCECGYNYHY